MPYLAESEISQVEWRVRQLHEKIRELGGDSSRRVSTSHLDAAISERRQNLEKLRSTPAGVTAAPVQPSKDFTAEINRLREQAVEAKLAADAAQSQEVKLQDELTELNTEKLKRLARLERLEEIIKMRRIDLGRDLRVEQNKLRDLRNRRVTDSGTVQLKRQLDRKGKQLNEKEKLWYSYSQAKQKGSLTERGRKKEEQALKSEVRGLKSEIRQLQEQLQKKGRIGAAAGSARTTGLVRRQLKVIAEVAKELEDINKDLDREREEHDDFTADFHKRVTQINQELAGYQEEQRRCRREERDRQRKQQELEERQHPQSAPGQTSAQLDTGAGDSQIQTIERQIKNLQDQKAKADDKKFQAEKIELDMKVLERDVQMLGGAVATAEPQTVAMYQARLRRVMNDFNQAKEDYQKLKG